jgi:glucokinase
VAARWRPARQSLCSGPAPGVAGLVPYGDDEFVLASEGGHSTLPSASPREHLVIEHLRQQFGHVSTERALSGPGLENLYRAIAAIDGVRVPQRGAADMLASSPSSQNGRGCRAMRNRSPAGKQEY